MKYLIIFILCLNVNLLYCAEKMTQERFPTFLENVIMYNIQRNGKVLDENGKRYIKSFINHPESPIRNKSPEVKEKYEIYIEIVINAYNNLLEEYNNE